MMIFKRGGAHSFGLEFPVVIDEMIACDADDPCFQCPRFGAIQMECPVHFQENLLRQILSLIGACCKAVGQIVDSRVPVSNNDFPSFAVSFPALRYQFGVVDVQRSSSASTTG